MLIHQILALHELPDFVFHVFDHPSDVRYVRGRLADWRVLLRLKEPKIVFLTRHAASHRISLATE